MSTNYYVEVPECENACDHCCQPKLLHIGKNFTMFQAYLESPFGPIRNFNDWIKVLRNRYVISENKDKISSGRFIELCLQENRALRSKQYRYMVDNYDCEDHDDFIDIYGFSFTYQDFS